MADDENIIVTDDEPVEVDIKQFPPMFNDTAVSFFPEIENSPENIENVHRSEGGRKIVQSVRKDVLNASVKLKVADFDWVTFFYDLYVNEDSVTFKQFSPLLSGYETRTVRITNFKYKKIKKSEDLAVNGTWEMSFGIEEF